MKKIFVVFISLFTLFVLASCYTTTFINEDKQYSFEPGIEPDASVKLVDGTLYYEAKTDNGDKLYYYYTKSQQMYDMFELSLVNNIDKTSDEAETMIEFYCGNCDTDSWNLAGKWLKDSHFQYNEETTPLIFVKENRKYFANSSENNTVSGRIYVKQFFDDYKIVYTTVSGEKITSYFKLVRE